MDVHYTRLNTGTQTTFFASCLCISFGDITHVAQLSPNLEVLCGNVEYGNGPRKGMINLRSFEQCQAYLVNPLNAVLGDLQSGLCNAQNYSSCISYFNLKNILRSTKQTEAGPNVRGLLEQ